ncbi:RFIP1 protein, partial [Ramphastos sulfuratus]|nr:RFIP1 protein [Ramphastos sulfuratus]
RSSPPAAAMSGLGAGSAPAWVPTHVQVTVLRARGLRAKAAAGGGGSDAYTVMALGREKFSTSVAERCQGQPLWREEATFELPPPPRPAALRLTVLHRALVGLDKFLGRAEVDLAALRADGGRRHTRWYKLRSKPGKKEKERGEIEVDIQFMRSNMTASMFDLSAKDKSRSAFGKLKDKLKGKRGSGFSDTASAIVPSSAHSSGDSDEEAVEKEKKKSKLKSLFSKPGLQKNSLSQSMSVLPTQQPVTQRVLLRPSDFQSQWDDEESETSPASDSEWKSSPSPVLKSRKTATLDRHLNQVAPNHLKKEGLSLFSGLKSKNDPVSKSSLCINGSHVYMEESRTKDNTPASSPSPHNFRRKQLFASEENLSSRSAKLPEEAGRTSPSHAFSGSASLETFKSMTLPSYKLLSSEEHLEPSLPPSVEITKETKKTEHKKSALLSLVTGKKDGVKSSDAENIPDRTLQDEANKVPEEKSEQETKHPELAADGSRESPSGDSHHAEDVCAKKQPLNPFEEEQRPEKAPAPAKTKAVKPRLGLPAEEETKATLPTLAPESLPTFLSGHSVRSGNNPFVPKTGQKAQGPDPENRPGTAASLTSPPPLAAELFSGKNPFTPEWGRAPSALHPEGGAHFPSSLAPPVPKAPPPGQVSGSTNNPFASGWGQSSWGQGPESSSVPASQGVPASVSSECHFNDNNPFVSKLGWEADVPSFKAVASSPPLCLAGDESCSPEHPAELEHSGHGAAGSNADVALTGGDVKAAPNPLGTPSDSSALAPEKQCSSSLSPGIGAKQLPSPESRVKEEQEIFGEKRGEEYAPRETPLDKDDSFPPAAPGRPTLGACALSPQQAEVRRAGSEVPKPAPRLSVTLKCLPDSQAAELSAAVPSSGHGVQPVAGPLSPNGRSSDAAECLPQSCSLVTVVLRDHSSNRHSKTEGEDDLVDCIPKLKSAVALCGERGLRLANLPVILEGGSDDELLGDCQEASELATGVKNLSETGKWSLGAVPLHEDLQEHSSSSAAAQIIPADLEGRAGSAAGACEPSRAPELPARVGVDSAKKQVADSGLGMMSHSREQDTPLEEQELNRSAGAEQDFSEPSVSFSSLSSPPQPSFSSHPLPSDTPNHRAEAPKKPAAEGSAAKAGNCAKKKLLQAWVSPSDICPNLSQQSGETLAPKHRLHPVKPMNATANKPQSKTLNVISTMNEKLLEMNMKKYEPSDPAYAYAQLTHDELIQLVLKQKDTITRKDLQVRELEDYIDNLLVRVMEETPNILRVSTSGNKKAGKM